MRSTWLIEDLEAHLAGESIAVYLWRKMAVQWTLGQIQSDLESRTGIRVSLATLSNWTRRMGYNQSHAASIAWKSRMVQQVVLEERYRRSTFGRTFAQR